jgi:guanylate kinase
MNGVQTIKKSKLDCKYIFIAPPSIPELERRLRSKKSEIDKIDGKLENAKLEIEYSQKDNNFDAIIVNSDVNKTFVALINLLQNWFWDLDLYLEN